MKHTSSNAREVIRQNIEKCINGKDWKEQTLDGMN